MKKKAAPIGSAGAVRPIRAKVGKGLFRRVFGGNSYIHCIVELIKNCRDWGATLILIDTGTAHLLRVVDNGDGMDAENRDAFFSVNESSAHTDPRKSGKFGSGAKKIQFSFATKTRVVTAPKDEPDRVYIFEFTTEDYEALALSGGSITPERERRTKQNWPYDFDFGTEITYELANPSLKGILRGARLASELAARLPRKLLSRIQVDEKELPEKEVIGDVFEVVETLARAGEASLELYRPAKQAAEERLRLGSVEVGEATFDELLAVMPGHLRERVPPLFLLRSVCGTITAQFLSEHANENRITLNPSIADDPRLTALVEMLRRHAPEIQRKLGIRFGEEAVDGADSAAHLREMAAAFHTAYGGGNISLPVAEDGEAVGGGGRGRGRKTPHSVRLHLDRDSREYTPGEEIVVRVTFQKGLKHTAADLTWDLSRARGAILVRTQDDGVVLKLPSDAGLGNGHISADIRLTPHNTRVDFEVVRERALKLSLAPSASIVLGRQLTLRVHNADVAQGVLEWELTGVGGIEKISDTEALFTGSDIGTALVSVRDSKNHRATDTCELTVGPPPQLVIRIRKHVFRVDVINITGNVDYDRPVVMIPVSDEFSDLHVSTGSSAYQAALSAGTLRELLVMSTALEYGRHVVLEAPGDERQELAELDPRDLPGVLQRIQSLGHGVLAEMLQSMKPLPKSTEK